MLGVPFTKPAVTPSTATIPTASRRGVDASRLHPSAITPVRRSEAAAEEQTGQEQVAVVGGQEQQEADQADLHQEEVRPYPVSNRLATEPTSATARSVPATRMPAKETPAIVEKRPTTLAVLASHADQDPGAGECWLGNRWSLENSRSAHGDPRAWASSGVAGGVLWAVPVRAAASPSSSRAPRPCVGAGR